MESLNLSTPMDATDIGKRIRIALRKAEALILSLPPETAGHLFVDDTFQPLEPDPADATTLRNPLAPRQGGLVPRIRDDLGPQ